MDQVDYGDHNPPWWTRSVQDHCGPHSNIFLMLLLPLDLIKSGRFYLTSGPIQVGKWSTGRDMRIVDMEVVIRKEHAISSRERQWIVNYRIDLGTFNDIY